MCAMVPEEVRSILEVGCGDGLIINRITADDTMGIDLSDEGLSNVTGPSLQCSVAELPFEDSRYELVIASEVIEHLADDIYRQALSEIARVAGRYILVSVPDRENLKINFTRCPACGKEYHRNLHQRSYQAADLHGLFEGFTTAECRPIGNIDAFRTAPEVWLRRVLDRGRPVPWGTTCPYCGSAHREPMGATTSQHLIEGGGQERSPWTRKLMWFLRGHKQPWLAALYSRTTEAL